MVLNAQVILESKGKAREVPLERFFSGDGKTPLVLKKGEILTEVTIPEEAMKGFSTYIKFSNRESIDFPIVGHAFWASTEGEAYRVSFTAVDRRPLRAKNIEGVLRGRDLNEEVVEEASGLAAEEAKPVKNSVYSPSYKRRMMGILLRCSMNEAIESAK
jgi:CO/xanthine dehydrogenase FAD-binding subunit